MSELNSGESAPRTAPENRFRIIVFAVAAFVLLAGTTIYLGLNAARGGSGGNAEQIATEGKFIYQNRCAMCHQDDGKGVADTYPPLIGAEHVMGDPALMVSIVLHGMVGPATVHGVKYNGVMPGMKDIMTSEEIAIVASYVRSSWGNKAPAVGSDLVERVRTETAKRTGPWNAEELK